MGGINHQPCSHYLRWSTRLSRAISLSRAELDLANVALEDVIVAELEGCRESRDNLVSHLKASLASLQDAKKMISDLRHVMEENGYKDLPTLHTLDLGEIGEQLSQSGLVERQAWDEMVKNMRTGTFFANLDLFTSALNDLHYKTSALMMVFGRVQNRSLSEVAEENQSSNFRIAFARLYTSWSSFHAHFLASSILSTEIWYAYMGYGSLVSTKKVSV